MKMVQEGEPHPGCRDCNEGFEGNHCQYAQGQAPLSDDIIFDKTNVSELGQAYVGQSESSGRNLTMYIWLAAMLTILAIIACCGMAFHGKAESFSSSSTVATELDDDASLSDCESVDEEKHKGSKEPSTDLTERSDSSVSLTHDDSQNSEVEPIEDV